MSAQQKQAAANRTMWLGFAVIGIVMLGLVVMSLVGSANNQPQVESTSAADAAQSDSSQGTTAQSDAMGGVSEEIAAICEEATPADNPDNRIYSEAAQVLENGVDYRAVFCTDAGPILIDLFEDETPITVNNFVFLARNDYYNNTIFHRVIENFMAQGGDPTGTGTGGPGYQFQDEFVPTLTFDRPGLLAMANAGPETNGSQFFITFAPTPHLNNRHTIFGEVLEGMDNVNNIMLRDPQNSSAPATTLETVVILPQEGADADSEAAEAEATEAAEAEATEAAEVEATEAAEVEATEAAEVEATESAEVEATEAADAEAAEAEATEAE